MTAENSVVPKMGVVDSGEPAHVAAEPPDCEASPSQGLLKDDLENVVWTITHKPVGANPQAADNGIATTMRHVHTQPMEPGPNLLHLALFFLSVSPRLLVSLPLPRPRSDPWAAASGSSC